MTVIVYTRFTTYVQSTPRLNSEGGFSRLLGDNSMDKQKEVGQRVRAYRRGLNLKQVELAALLDTRQAYISAVENGKVDITLSFLERTAEALGVDALRLIRDEVA